MRGVVLLNQVNKAGQFVGTNAVLHEVDVEIIVKEGEAVTGKNRIGFGPGRYVIFDMPSFQGAENLDYEFAN